MFVFQLEKKIPAMSLAPYLGRINGILIINHNSTPNPPGPHFHSFVSEISHFSTVKTSS